MRLHFQAAIKTPPLFYSKLRESTSLPVAIKFRLYFLSYSKLRWRNDKKSFDGTIEKRPPPKIYSGITILNQVQDLEGQPLTKDPKKRGRYHMKNERIIGPRKVFFLNFHIGNLFCCEIIWMSCILRKIYVII